MTLELYYDIVCPYAYLASTQIEPLAARHGATVQWEPVLLGGILRALYENGAVPTNPPKARLGLLDLQRWADHWAVPLRMPAAHPRRTVEAMRLCVAAAQSRAEVSHRLYRAYWVDGLDIADRAVLRDLVGTALVARLDDPELKDELRARTDAALERGVFGVPTIFVGGQLFWGQDRLHFVEKALTGWEVRA